MKKNYLLLGCMGVLVGAGCDFARLPEGHYVYQRHCQNCHMEDGSGLPGLIPPLAGADFLRLYPDKVVCMVRYGHQGGLSVNGVWYDGVMPANERLSDTDITNVMNYINNQWGNNYGMLSPRKVGEVLERCAAEVGR